MTALSSANSRVSTPPDGPRLLPAGVGPTYAAHVARYGAVPPLTPSEVIDAARSARLVGRGGAGFPSWRKLEAAARAGRDVVVVGNAAESEPASAKDRTLLSVSPQLVLDGLAIVARLAGARRSVLYAHEGANHDLAAKGVAERTVALGRDIGIEVVGAPMRFVAGEESALANRVGGGPALPTSAIVRERGVKGRPTLVHNAETLAHLALLVRFGPAWFASIGDPQGPGTMLFSVSLAGSGDRAVVEAPTGTAYGEVLAAAGHTAPPQALLVGGYHGAWLPGHAVHAPARRADLAVHGVTPGAGVAIVLPHGTCALTYVRGVLAYLAAESAGQCGPCVNGLPALAEAFGRMVGGDRAAAGRVAALVGLVEGRGGCHHPDGTARLVRSTLMVFAADVEAHARGGCLAGDRTDDRGLAR